MWETGYGRSHVGLGIGKTQFGGILEEYSESERREGEDGREKGRKEGRKEGRERGWEGGRGRGEEGGGREDVVENGGRREGE